MTRTRRIVAVEGPCCAGKTTLGRGLLHSEMSGLSVVYVPCYADQVGGGRFLPRPVPDSLAEDEHALHALLDIESDRVADPRAHIEDLLLLDRSMHTLLAHRYALERMTGLGLFAPAWRVLGQSDILIWPDLVLYLDVPQAAIHDRNDGKFAENSIFINAEFNMGIRLYFRKLARVDEPPVVWLDATQDTLKLLSTADTHIRELLYDRVTPEKGSAG